jgi:RND family efflux transporter MFP subunit
MAAVLAIFRSAHRVILFATVLALSLAGCSPGDEPVPPAASTPAPAVVQGSVVEVGLAPLPIRVEVTGQVAAASQATLSSKIQGTVQELPVREGSAVSKGQVLVRLDSRDLETNLARAEAELENARSTLNRIEHLLAQDAATKQEVDDARRTFKVAEAGRRAAQVQLSYTVIKAPFDGVVTEKKVEVGELASPGQPLLKLEDPRRLRLETTVAEGDLKAIQRGAKMPVTIDALGPTPLQGTVAQILPTGDPATHTFLVKIDLPPAPGLKTGMFGRMQFEKGTSQTMVLPKSAVIERGQLTGVYVVGGDRIARLRWVKVGRRFEDRLEILSGLNVGELVLTDAAKGSDGARVEIIAAGPPR